MRLCKIVLLLCCLLVYVIPLATNAQIRTAYIDSALTNPNALKLNCGVDAQMSQLRKSPTFQALEKKTNEAITKRILGSGAGSPPVDTILLPIVFHIINPNPFSISDLSIINAVKDLNDAFSKTGAYAASYGADTRIRFRLAQKDPNGGSTTGIDRVVSFYNSSMNMNLEDGRLKNLVQWDPNKYINVWVVNSIVGEISADFSCGSWTRAQPAGYATLGSAGGAGSSSDGIVVSTFGTVLAHEMGHYLGLYHTFEGGCTNNDCTVDGDRVCDTPPDGSTRPSPSCTNPENSCGTDTLSSYSNGYFKKDTTDQIANFMDYGNNGCSNQFTEGQSERMRATIATFRTGLLPDAFTKPCAENSVASFTRNISYPIAGNLVNFNNTSIGATNFKWLVDDVPVATSTQFSYTFPTAGKTKVTLIAYNGDANCYAAYSDYVTTNCGVTARFTNNKNTIASKGGIYIDSILFTNNSVGATSYQWIITDSTGLGRSIITSNAGGGAAKDLSYIFYNPGTYQVKLIAQSAGCTDSLGSQTITVLDPTADAYISILNVNCYQQTKIRVQFYVCNFGYAPLHVGMPVSFYDADPRTGTAHKIDKTFLLPDSLVGRCCGYVYTQILDVTYPRLNQLYAVVNDIGTSVPVVLPNATQPEKDFTNNIVLYSSFQFKVSSTPTTATLEPGDLLRITTQTTPASSGPFTYTWSSTKNLSCTNCASPQLTADSTRIKTVIAASQYQCYDTAYVNILVPPTDDFTVAINNAVCVPNQDSINIAFTLSNLFKRGNILKNLAVSFYQKDPATTGAVLLGPVFKVPANVAAKQQGYTWKIKKAIGTNLYASVNDDGSNIPIQLANAFWPEKAYNNNVTNFSFLPLVTTIDTAICRNQNVAGYTNTGTYIDSLVTVGGCDSIRILHLLVNELPANFLPNDTLVCFDRPLHINLSNYVGVAWNTRNNSTSKQIDINTPGSYSALVLDKNGCRGTDTVNIEVSNCIPILIPNAFSPNSDGRNDVFRPTIGIKARNYLLQIWNRWGQLLFETRTQGDGWNGRYNGEPQPNGAYVYFISMLDLDGNLINKRGTFVLIK